MEVETGILDTPAVESTPVDTTPDAGAEVTETPEGTARTDGQPDPDKTDRRQNPDALRKTLKWLRENGGEHSAQAQAIERILGESKSYKTVYPTVREAREARQAIEAVGGVAKIAELQQSISRYQQIDQRLEDGDPSVIDDILETGGKGLTKILPSLIDKLSAADAAGVQAVMQPHAVKFMESQGLADAIDAMVGHFNANEPAKAKEVLARIINWYKGLGKGEAPKVDPAQEKFQQERDKFYQEKYQGEVSRTFGQVISHAEEVLSKQLAADIKRLGLSTDSAQLLKEDAWKKLEKLRNADAIFEASKGTKFNDKSRTVSPDAAVFVNGYTDRFAKEACDWAVRMRYGHIKGTAPAASATQPVKPNPTAPPGTPIALDHQMTIARLGRSAAQDAILRGEGFSRDGKKIVKQGKVWKYA